MVDGISHSLCHRSNQIDPPLALGGEIVRQAVDAFNRLQSQSEQINMTRHALTAAEERLRLARQRQEFGVGIVLENILAEQDLTRARTGYLKAIAELDKAQYGLSKAVGMLPAFP